MSGNIPIQQPSELRGIFGEKGDSTTWLDTVANFPNGVPRFETKGECLEFMVDYNTHNGGSNPYNPNLMHIFTMLTSWDQVEKVLLPNIEKARREVSFAKPVPRDYLAATTTTDALTNSRIHEEGKTNVYEDEKAQNVIEDINFRLDLPIHRCTTPNSTYNTLKYLFFHMKCGIFVMIRNRKLRIFAPFVNSDYRNTWGDALTVEGGSLDTYYSQKAGLYREENVEKDRSKWWANGNIICNELSKDKDIEKMQHWGDHFLAPLRDMLGTYIVLNSCRTINRMNIFNYLLLHS